VSGSLRFVVLLCLVCLVPAAAAAGFADPPATGSMRFDVHYGSQGFKVGSAQHSWSLADGRYELELELEARGLAGLFGLQYRQHSRGLLSGAGLRPELFSVEQRGRKSEAAHFDWPAGRVSIRRDGAERRSGTLEAGAQDLLSLWHQASHVARNGRPVSLQVITNKSVKDAVLEPDGKESLSLPIGKVETLRLRAHAEDGGLNIRIWLSVDHGLLPVRIRIEDEKGGVLDQRAAAIETGRPAATATGTKN